VGAAAIVGASALASARGTADNNDQANNTVITNSAVDNVNFLGADESFNLVSNNNSVRDEIAAAIYFRDMGSRKGLTISQSNIEYEASSTNIKNVYTSKAITDIRKLVTEGYIKIERQTQDVDIATEKATI
jgi:hypothetical protein